jgi:hypothetical protein
MSAEIFKFLSVRPAQPLGGDEPLRARLDPGKSAFLERVRGLQSQSDEAQLKSVAEGFVRSGGLIDGSQEFDVRMLEIHGRLAALLERDFPKSTREEIHRQFDPVSLATGLEFRNLMTRLTETIVTLAIVPGPQPARPFLSRLAAMVGVVQAVSTGRAVTQPDFIRPVIVLPDGLVPSWADPADLSTHRKSRASFRERRTERRRSRLSRLSKALSDYRDAADELIRVVRRRTAPAESSTEADAGFLLSQQEVNSLSNDTKGVLSDLGLAGQVDVSLAMTLIDRKRLEESTAHAALTRAGRMVKVGGIVLPDRLVHGLFDEAVDTAARHPGPCPPQTVEAPEEGEEPTIPTGHGEARVLGIADLMVVEQELARYELSEIAHIENVLRRERRERRFRTATTTEESRLVENETTEEKEKDLSSAERFELQAESSNVINEAASRQAGLTINASYGPSVEATATFGTSMTSSRQESDRTSSDYARETTSRAVSRLQKRTLERRFNRTVWETEEHNLHAFDNRDAGTDISGVYRFVDKIYSAQVVNYGKRLLLEFIVPQPAAFWRHALAKQPLAPVTHACPEEPGYCLEETNTFMPLQASDIEPENYMYWASLYDAADVRPPPPSTMMIGHSTVGKEIKPKTAKSDQLLSSTAFDIDIPDGYQPLTGHFNIYGETQKPPSDARARFILQVQAQEHDFVDETVWKDVPLDPATVTVTLNTIFYYNYEFTATILCNLSLEKKQEWQLQTYFAIRNAFKEAKNRYDTEAEAARIRAGYEVAFGRNPARNREIEQIELKRACIEMMSNQRFETFDAMNRSVPPHGYPEIDFVEAKAEARFVQLFEQGIEWPNMTYVFYPYFWSRKDEWLVLAQLEDDDPFFARFLQAGSARVQLPVRPGFESSFLNYFKGVKIWDASGELIVFGDDDPHLPLVTEIKNQTGNFNQDGPGRLAVTHGSVFVDGDGTAFSAPKDTGRRIVIRGISRIIKQVEGAERIELTQAYEGSSETEVGYELGPRIVGEPWEVRIPTNLVKLADYQIS